MFREDEKDTLVSDEKRTKRTGLFRAAVAATKRTCSFQTLVLILTGGGTGPLESATEGEVVVAGQVGRVSWRFMQRASLLAGRICGHWLYR